MYILRNCMEGLVIDMTHDIMSSTDVCDCDKCRLDIVATALNHLPALYSLERINEKFGYTGNVYNYFSQDLRHQILKAISVIRKNPRHDRVQASEYHLKNAIEEIMDDTIDDYIVDSSVCRCPKCRLEIMAAALNRLPTVYTVTKMGSRLAVATSNIRSQFAVDIRIAVMTATERVDHRNNGVKHQ